MLLFSLSLSLSLCIGVQHCSGAAVVQARSLLLCLFIQKEPGQVE